MEPPLPPFHPKLPSLLEHLKLRIVDAIKWNVLLCVSADDDKNAPTHVLKFGIDPRKNESLAYETRIMREAFPAMDESGFETLVLPEFLGGKEHDGMRWLLMKYIDGKPLVREWSELTFKDDLLGGKKIDEKVATLAVDVLRDLRMVDTTRLPDFVRGFDFAQWLDSFKVRSGELVEAGLLERSGIEAALKIFTGHDPERYLGSVFTNGDFYPRNFIITPDNRVAVVDWVGGIDPWDFVAMYAWLLMWNNAKWQVRYVTELKKHFRIDGDEMQIGLLVKSFDMVYRWKDQPEVDIGFARTQMLAYFHHCLDLDYVRQLFG